MSFINNNEIPEGKGLFAFSDQAGANACMALAYMLIQEKKEQPYLVTNQSRHINNSFGLKVHLIEGLPDLNEFKPAYIFTGTSHPESSKEFEIRIVNAANNKFIYSISFVDHWVNFRMRFLINNRLLVEPNKIWVVNSEAKQLAIAEGLDEKKITIHDNPYHYFLSNCWKPAYNGKSYLKEKLGIKLKDPFVILYAPDPISLRNQNSDLQFDEVSVLELLLKVLSEIKRPDILLIVKPHPLQDQHLLNKKLENSNIQSFFISDADNHELINASDLVIGIYSNFLIEAECLNKPVIRFFSGPAHTDLLRYTNTGQVVNSKAGLFESLINNIK